MKTKASKPGNFNTLLILLLSMVSVIQPSLSQDELPDDPPPLLITSPLNGETIRHNQTINIRWTEGFKPADKSYVVSIVFNGTEDGNPTSKSLYYGTQIERNLDIFIPCRLEGALSINVQWGFTPVFAKGQSVLDNPTPLQVTEGETVTNVVNVVRSNLPVAPPFHFNLVCDIENVDVYAPEPPPDCVGCEVKWYLSINQNHLEPEHTGNPFPKQNLNIEDNAFVGSGVFYYRYSDGCDYYSSVSGQVRVIGFRPPPTGIVKTKIFAGPKLNDCQLPSERHELSYDASGYMANINAELNSNPETSGSSVSGRTEWRGGEFITEELPPNSGNEAYIVCREHVACVAPPEFIQYKANFFLSADIQLNNPDNPSETYFSENFIDACEFKDVQTDFVADENTNGCNSRAMNKSVNNHDGQISVSQDLEGIKIANNKAEAGLVQLYNTQGSLIFSGKIKGESNLSLSKNDLKTGVYLIKTQLGKEVKSSKIFISNK